MKHTVLEISVKDDLAEAQSRSETWWTGNPTDRALIQAAAPRRKPLFEIDVPQPPTVHDYWTNPACVIPRILANLGNTWFGGESFPVLYPVAGRMVSILCKYLGAPNVYIGKDTTWSQPIITDWDTAPDLRLDLDQTWWRITIELLEACTREIEQRSLTCFLGLPDLNGPTEVLSGLRGPQSLCIDLITEPDNVKAAARAVQDAWFDAWRRLSPITGRFGGYFNWMGIWSGLPAVDLQSDFSTLISIDHFAEFVLPLLAEQTEAFPRTVFHLDGPGMIRHLDLILQLPKLSAVQWIQGAGAGRVSEWMDLMHTIQASGKSLQITCEPDEVEYLTSSLDSRGLMLWVQGCRSEEEGAELLGIAKRSGSKRWL